MIEQIGFWGSAAAGFVLLLMCVLGLRGFLGLALRASDPASRMLGWAIICGFAASGLNALYWQVVGQLLIASGAATLPHVRLIGSFLDIALKGGAATAIFFHLAARRLNLPPAERRNWSVLGMAFYPRADSILARALNATCWRNR